MLILNRNGTYIRFKHGKMGRKISGDNADVYSLYKSPFGIASFSNKQMFATITLVHLSLLMT